MGNAIFIRTSVRQFEGKGIEAEKVKMLLRAGMVAPSAVNQQPWEFFVVTNAGNTKAEFKGKGELS